MTATKTKGAMLANRSIVPITDKAYENGRKAKNWYINKSVVIAFFRLKLILLALLAGTNAIGQEIKPSTQKWLDSIYIAHSTPYRKGDMFIDKTDDSIITLLKQKENKDGIRYWRVLILYTDGREFKTNILDEKVREMTRYWDE